MFQHFSGDRQQCLLSGASSVPRDAIWRVFPCTITPSHDTLPLMCTTDNLYDTPHHPQRRKPSVPGSSRLDADRLFFLSTVDIYIYSKVMVLYEYRSRNAHELSLRLSYHAHTRRWCRICCCCAGQAQTFKCSPKVVTVERERGCSRLRCIGKQGLVHCLLKAVRYAPSIKRE